MGEDLDIKKISKCSKKQKVKGEIDPKNENKRERIRLAF